MSIRAFSRRPCETCKEDTLHLAGKCRVCGTIAVNASDLSSARMKAKMADLTAKHGSLGARQILCNEREDRERQRNWAMKRDGQRSKDLPAKFGSGTYGLALRGRGLKIR